MEKDFRMLAKTFEGLEKVLAEEITSIGGKKVEVQRRAVSFEGDMELMYRANLWLRTAISILKPISSFKAESEQELYDGIYSIKWFEYFDVGKSFSIDTVLVNSNITHSMYATYKVKDAIADQFRYYFNQRPDVGRGDADININVYISGNQCEVSLNSSGVPLFKRGYRQSGHKAPINEALAAGLIKLSNWDMNSNFIDPMCGSGTLLVEAALMAYNFPPAFLRESFSFMMWSNYDPTIWRKITSETTSKQRDFEYRIIGGDISERNLNVAREIINEIKFHKDIELFNIGIINHKAPDDDAKGVVVTNPPYGERLKSEDLEGLYSQIGDAFKNNFPGYKAWVISSDMDALKSIGLKTSVKIPLFNGPLDCRFNSYDLYEGTKRTDIDILDDKTENNDEVVIEETIDNELLVDLYIGNKVKGEKKEDRGERNEERGRGERRNFDKDRGERRSFDKDRGERRSFDKDRGERRSFDKDRGERRSFDKDRGERRSFDKDRGERRSFDKDRGERRSFDKDRGERRSFDKDRGERKSFDKDRGERRSFDKDRGERKSFDKDRGERKSFDKDRGERRSFDKDSGERSANVGQRERRSYDRDKGDEREEKRYYSREVEELKEQLDDKRKSFDKKDKRIVDNKNFLAKDKVKRKRIVKPKGGSDKK